MAKNTFEFRIPDCDIDYPARCRDKLIGIINEEEFETFIRGVELTRVASGGSPAPRGGEASVSCHAESGGGWGCKGEVSIRF